MNLVPDGNSSEFLIYMGDGSQFSSKRLPVISSSEENGRLKFVFEEHKGVTVSVEYWLHEDGNCISKQLTLSQSDDAVIDAVLLENVGIVNSKTHFSLDYDAYDESNFITSLGQPFYIDSLFFGCEFPGANSKIYHGRGQVKYYIGKNVGNNFKCPVTVMGGGKDNTLLEVKKAFFEHIDFISTPRSFTLAYKDDFAGVKKPSEQTVSDSFSAAFTSLNAPDMPDVSRCIIGSAVWANSKAPFWSFNKRFPSGLDSVNQLCRDNNAKLGITLSPSGWDFNIDTKKLAKKIEKAGNGFMNKEAGNICTASAIYNEKLGDFICNLISQYDLSYINFGSFGYFEGKLCTSTEHDHISGRKNDAYCVTEMLENRVKLLKKIRAAKENIIINFSLPDNYSPFWLQWINTLELEDIEAEIDVSADEDAELESKITMQDAVYYGVLCKNSAQFPAGAAALEQNKEFTEKFPDYEFSKYILWSAVRGQSAFLINCSLDALSHKKREALSKAIAFQRENYDILKNASFIGGDPAEGNIYGYVSFTEEGEGIVALRNPTNEDTPLTLTFNKLMGVSEENFKNMTVERIYCLSDIGGERFISYNDKLDITLHPYDIMILKFTN